MLQLAIKNVTKVANERNLHSISIPAISTGIFMGDVDLCAAITAEEVYRAANDQCSNLETIRLVFNEMGKMDKYIEKLKEIEKKN